MSLANPFALFVFGAYGAMGFLLAVRRPRNPVGWLLIAVAAGESITAPVARPWTADLLSGTAAGWVPFFVLVQRVLATAGNLVPFALLASIFPTGRWPRGWVGRISAMGIVLIAAIGAMQAFAPTLRSDVFRLSDSEPIIVVNPIGIAAGWAGWGLLEPGGTAVLIGEVGLGLCVLGFIVRFRRSVGVERFQDKWLVGSLAFLVISVVWGSFMVVVFGGAVAGMDGVTLALVSAIAWGPGVIALLLVPIAIGIAVLRYRLYEIDRIISRTISYGLVTASLIAVYAGVILLLQAPLSAVTGGDTIAVAASTLAVAGLFQPLRRRIQGAVDRRFNRARYDAQRTVEAFAGHLRTEVDLARLRAALIETADDAVRPSGATVWLRPGSEPGS